MYQLAILNGLIVEEDRIYRGNIYVDQEKITAVTEPDTILEADSILDVKGNYIFPGFIDVHSHLGDFTGEYEQPQYATAAAAVGGFTTCIEMPNTFPAVANADILREKAAGLSDLSFVDFALYGALTKENQCQLKELHDNGAISFKSFLSEGGRDFTSPDMYEAWIALKKIKEFNGLAAFHCEDFDITSDAYRHMQEFHLGTREAYNMSRPLLAEILATQNIIEVAKDTGCKIHICHVSHPYIASIIERYQRMGVDVTGETCVHYLTYTEDDFIEKGCLYKCAPPLRSKEAQNGLWKYLEKGVLLCVSSDHSCGPESLKDDTKRPTYETHNGISGIQTAVTVFYHEAVNKRGFSPTFLTKTMSANPARRWGIYGQKGSIQPGFDADLVIFDPNQEYTITSDELYYLNKISAFVGYKGTGRPVMTLLRGQIIARDNVLCKDNRIGKQIFRNNYRR